ncbi:MAG: hypothetical protein AB7I38_13205 [Dehalococcoidia bacterium]
MTADAARALLAGFIAGAAGAFATTFLIMVFISRNSAWQRLPQNRRVPMPLVGVVFVNLMMLLWTAAGLVFGAVYLRAESDWAGSSVLLPNWRFTLACTALIALVVATVALIRGRVGTMALLVALIAHLAFAWMLPNLAR